MPASAPSRRCAPRPIMSAPGAKAQPEPFYSSASAAIRRQPRGNASCVPSLTTTPENRVNSSRDPPEANLECKGCRHRATGHWKHRRYAS